MFVSAYKRRAEAEECKPDVGDEWRSHLVKDLWLRGGGRVGRETHDEKKEKGGNTARACRER
jgi:hypothetical protein